MVTGSGWLIRKDYLAVSTDHLVDIRMNGSSDHEEKPTQTFRGQKVTEHSVGDQNLKGKVLHGSLSL
jgi:hypothetical protein